MILFISFYPPKNVRDRGHLCNASKTHERSGTVYGNGQDLSFSHYLCNLKYRKLNFTPVVFHNLSGYDSHLFVKNLGFSDASIDCIPNNEKRYIRFTKEIQVGSYTKKVKNEEKTTPLHLEIRFIDSFKFMNER